ncbi:MAG: class I SAM-dependent RNA methyltransferase [Oscillospiraceae bacterium]|nr:class I SAM-dependent RNA methyltransferase [Oscillospiraceae bacterium]MDD6856727.1 class I SAM-dependent RNA methyltransferase [Oscillospiraceae bacterium]
MYMDQMEFYVPCLFGLEGLTGDELRRLNMDNVRVENGRVLFSGDARALAKANVCLRTGERVLIVLADFRATTFEELFQGVYNTPLEAYIPKDGAFPVKGHCLNSTLMSVPDCQAIVKKAASRRLGEKYGISWLPETGAKYQLQFSLMNDRAQLFLDTSGPGLHKRGYRANANDAPLRETLAAAMVILTRYRGREFLWDPFCGSGTIPIEAAMIAKNKAPGAYRRFSAEAFAWMDPKLWGEVRTEAKDREFHGNYRILGSDNDPKCVSLAMANARKAGLGDLIDFRDGDATKLSLPCDEGILICNPPYGQRMMEQQSAQRLYAALGRHLKFADGWKKYVITSEPEFEHYFGKRADKKRKLYNGMIKCDYYMYLGPKQKGKR